MLNTNGMTTQLEVITPDKAEEILEKNTINRKIRSQHVRNYAEQMKNGNWHLTHEGIALGTDGKVLDGQHRLLAVIKSNVPVTMLVSRNAPQEIIKHIDIGAKRTTSDIFEIHHIKNSAQHAGGINKYLSFRNKTKKVISRSNTNIKNNVTHDDTLNFYFENEEFLKEVLSKSKGYYSKFNIRILTTSDIYMIYCYLNLDKGHSMELISDFFDNVYMIENTSKSNAPKLLFEKLVNCNKKTGTVRVTPSAKTAMIIKAWNYHLEGKDRKTLYYNEGVENYPEFK